MEVRFTGQSGKIPALSGEPMSSINSIDPTRRKLLVASLASLASACTMGPSSLVKENHPDAKNVHGNIRPPAIGQQWIYQVTNLYTGSIVDQIIETVVAITPLIEIQRKSRKHGVLPSEIHSSWGLVSSDSYWSPPVQFLKPIPLWPQASGEIKSVTTQYQVEDDSGTYPWTSRLTPLGSETIALGSGQVSAMKYSDDIVFQSNDAFRTECSRVSTIWLSRELGRWVRRTTHGRFYDWSERNGIYQHEDYLQYELKSWK